MLRTLLARLQQGYRTMPFPSDAVTMPDRFRGAPLLDRSKCKEGCRACAEACPTDAITAAPGSLKIDLGRCLFCTDCTDACPEGAISFSRDYRLSTRSREELVVEGSPLALARALEGKMLRLFGRSLKLRQVSAAGCNGCESDVNVLGTVGWDLGRFGIQMVASPRHADGILVTGAVSRNMALALRKTYDAIPAPKLVIAVGACAISGGPYLDHPEIHNGAGGLIPVDLYVPGCPPHPATLLDGLLRLLGRLEETSRP
jgi:Ni,Fe-hydrogenase III small subunit/NAD-dependent dihydropyrimidine dehydrogenase PreA subunit